MKISDIALKIWAAQIVGIIPSRAQFHKLFTSEASFLSAIEQDSKVIDTINQLKLLLFLLPYQNLYDK